MEKLQQEMDDCREELAVSKTDLEEQRALVTKLESDLGSVQCLDSGKSAAASEVGLLLARPLQQKRLRSASPCLARC